MSEQAQFGFDFETEAEIIQNSVEEVYEEPETRSPLEVSAQTFLIPELEEEAREREAQQEEIPWTQYIRMVQLFFDERGHEEFRELTSKLAILYGTKNVTDTTLEGLRNAARRPNV